MKVKKLRGLYRGPRDRAKKFLKKVAKHDEQAKAVAAIRCSVPRHSELIFVFMSFLREGGGGRSDSKNMYFSDF